MTKTEIIDKCGYYEISNYHVNDDGSISVDGDVNLSGMQLTELPVRFKYVSGHFQLDRNSLKSLIGSPKKVGGSFSCSTNELATLEFSPIEVGANFNCQNNNLVSLVGSPTHIVGNFNCFDNLLTTLIGGPVTVDGDYYAYNNSLDTLIGSPKVVIGVYHVGGNNLTNLLGIPRKVGSLYFDDTLTSTYNGYEDCYVQDYVRINNQDPAKFKIRLPRVITRNEDKLRIILKYQQYFEIWNHDFSLNPVNFDELLYEIDDGLL
jgi:hypothetical protein